MAEPISIQQLKDASEDAISLAEFINKPENAMIPRRLASEIHSLQYYLEYMKSFAQRSYETYDDMVANASNLSENVSVFVTNDSDTSKNGIYTYNGTSFTKGDYQPENAAKEFVEAKLGGLEIFDGKIRAQDVSTVNDVGAVERNQRDKNADQVSVKDYGALGDGTGLTVQSWIDEGRFDTLAAIQTIYPHCESLSATIDRVCMQAALNNGGSILIPKGDYIVDSALLPTSNSDITGTKDTLITYANGFKSTDWISRSLITFNTGASGSVTNVRISNMTLDANRHLIDQTTTFFHCIGIYGTRVSKLDYSRLTNIVIDNVRMLRPTLDGVYVRFSDGVVVKNCHVFDAGRSSYVVVGAKNVKIIDNTGVRAYNSYVDLETHVDTEDTYHVEVRGNTFTADSLCTAEGIGLTGLGSQEKVSITGNYFKLNGRFGNFGGKYNEVSDNTVICGQNGTTDGALNSISSESCSVVNNKITVVTAGSSTTMGAMRLRNGVNLLVESNTIDMLSVTNLLKGIIVSSSFSGESNNVKVINNTVFGSLEAISVEGTGCTISGNTVSSSSRGLFVKGSYHAVNGNMFTGCPEAINASYASNSDISKNTVKLSNIGISSSNGSGNTYSSNSFSECTRAITCTIDSNTTINSNTFVRCGGDGDYSVVLDSRCKTILIHSNVFIDCKGTGAIIRGSDIKFSDNTYINNAEITLQNYAFEVNKTQTIDPIIVNNNFKGCANIAPAYVVDVFKVPPVLKIIKDYAVVDGAIVVTDKVYTFKNTVDLLNTK